MNTPDEMWQALLAGRDAIVDLPEGRWSEFLEEPRLAELIAKARTRGGYLSDIKGFDSEFFALSKMEADNLDPQQRMALELTWEALENARIPASGLRGDSVGVYIGTSTNDYSFLAVSDPTVAHPYAITGTASSIIANRVSYFFDFRGPSMALDTACSSSLVAVHQGVQALRNGEADVVLAGGVNALITPMVTIGFDEVGGVLADDGRIKSFSADADGYARSEGGGMLVLKRVADARRDGDQIIAVIAGSAVNHDGRSNGLLAPNPDAQAAVLRRAYKDAGINPRLVDYIEAHGTGTILGDPIEAEALGRVVGRGRTPDNPALLGAVKSNVGHLESAAGAASLVKMALALQHDKLPPSINYTGPNPYIDFEAVRLKVADTVTEWPRYSGYAIAGVSGFGFGGANAHVVLREVLPRDVIERESEPEPEVEEKPAADDENTTYVGGVRFDEYGEFVDHDMTEAPAEQYELPGLTDEALRLKEIALDELQADEPAAPVVPLAISAFLTSRKKAAAAELADWIDSPEGRAASLESIGRSLSRRNHGRSRAVVLAHDHDEAIKGLRAVSEGKQRPNVFAADGPVTNGPVWVLAGFGAQHRKMAKSLYLRDEVFADWINTVDSLVQDERGYSIVELILDDAQDYGIETTQIVIFAIQVALGELLKHHGAKPAAVIGQSLGEAAAAYFAGGLSLEDATRTISSRSHLMGEGEAMLFGEYIRLMALVEYSADEIKTVFSDFPDLEVCVYAAPTQTVIGGPPEQVDAIIERAEKEGKFARKFQTKGASHTSQMDPLLGELTAELQGIEPLPTKIGYFSTVHEGGYIRPGGEPFHGVEYWKQGLRHSVYFTHGVRNAVDSGYTTFLELAPNPVALMQVGLSTAAAGLHDAQLIATLARKEDEVESMTVAMAQLFVYGHDLDIRTLFTRAAGPQDYANIPPTRFRRKEHWLNARFAADGSVFMPGTHVAMPDGRHVWEYAPRGETDLAALVKAAAALVLPDATLTASELRAVPGDGARLVTTLTRHPGGASVQVHARIDESFTLVYDAVVTRSGASAALPAAVAVGTATAEPAAVAQAAAPVVEEQPDAEILHDNLTQGANLGAGFQKWSPDSGETVGQRLATIVASAMGYEPEDLPWEVPLIELGLDSLMAVRIKNRVEYDFDLPPIQLQAVRDANLYAVEKLIQYAIEHRDEVQQLHEYQQAQTAEEIGTAAGGGNAATAAGGGNPATAAGGGNPAAAQAELASDEAPPATPPPPPPPDNPQGPPREQPDLATAATALNQQAVAEALNSDVPPRDASERVTFATWAIVTGSSPGGIFTALPELDDETADKLAQRLSDRADGPITAEQVKTSPTIEALAEKVRDYLEAGQIDGFVRTIRAPQQGSSKIPVFVFHAAGGSTVVYEPLLNRLPSDTPMYGLERVEGTIEERAAQYVPKLREIAGDGPFILVGWSLGGVLAYACAIGLQPAGLRRAVRRADRRGARRARRSRRPRKRPAGAGNATRASPRRRSTCRSRRFPTNSSKRSTTAARWSSCWTRSSRAACRSPAGSSSISARRTWTTERSTPPGSSRTTGMSRSTWPTATTTTRSCSSRATPPASRTAAGASTSPDLEVVPIGGEHIQAIDEPIIAKVGAHMSQALSKIEAESSQESSQESKVSHQ